MTSAPRKLSTFAEIMREEEEASSQQQARRYSSFQAAYIAMEDAYDDYPMPSTALFIDNPLFEYTTEEEEEGEIPVPPVRKRPRLSVLALVRRTMTFKRSKTPPPPLPLPSFHALHGLEPPSSSNNKRESLIQRRSLLHGSLVM
ncbi:hypothetical protein BASA81_009128 [Batrachochytrium salamandrivorans]|nr:hypothetical protein BASA81_009128 [Batrachochytrium salamandrivorans]